MAPLLSRSSGEDWAIKSQGGAAAPPERSAKEAGPSLQQGQEQPNLQPASLGQLDAALSIAPALLQPAQALKTAVDHRQQQQQQRRRPSRQRAARSSTTTSPAEGGTASSCQGDAGQETTDLESMKKLFRFLRHSGTFQTASDEELWSSLPHWACQGHAPGSIILEAGAAVEAVHLVRHGKVQRVWPSSLTPSWVTSEQQRQGKSPAIEAGKALNSAPEPGQLMQCSGGLGEGRTPKPADLSQMQQRLQAELAGQGLATMQQRGIGAQAAFERRAEPTCSIAPGDDGAGSIGRGECLALNELLAGKWLASCAGTSSQQFKFKESLGPCFKQSLSLLQAQLHHATMSPRGKLWLWCCHCN